MGFLNRIKHSVAALGTAVVAAMTPKIEYPELHADRHRDAKVAAVLAQGDKRAEQHLINERGFDEPGLRALQQQPAMTSMKADTQAGICARAWKDAMHGSLPGRQIAPLDPVAQQMGCNVYKPVDRSAPTGPT